MVWILEKNVCFGRFMCLLGVLDIMISFFFFVVSGLLEYVFNVFFEVILIGFNVNIGFE